MIVFYLRRTAQKWEDGKQSFILSTPIKRRVSASCDNEEKLLIFFLLGELATSWGGTSGHTLPPEPTKSKYVVLNLFHTP